MDQRNAVSFEDDNLSPYRVFTREEWAKLRADAPMTLTAEEVVRLQSLNDPISLDEVAAIYRSDAAAAERFAAAARAAGYEKVIRAGTFAEAVEIANKTAKPPQVVLLSPACASYDMFDNYEQRGRVFKEMVRRGIDDE